MDAVKNAKRVVEILKRAEKVDLVICLSHLGTSTDKSKSEDAILVEKVPEINIVISGHTHTKLNQPIVVGKTIIGSTGEYGESLGVINLSRDSNQAWTLENYNLKPIDNNLNSNPEISKTIDKYKDILQEKYNSPLIYCIKIL